MVTPAVGASAMSRSADGMHRRADPEADASHRIVLLSKMIRAHGLDPVEAEEAHPAVMRSLRTGCTLCAVTSHCVRSLTERTAAAACWSFCLNAPVLNALTEYERVAKAASLLSLKTDRHTAP